MNFTADYANDLLRKLEKTHQSEGKSNEYIYSDSDFIQECIKELEEKKIEINKCVNFINKYVVQHKNRVSEIEDMQRCRSLMDEKVYRRIMDNAVRRRRKAMQRYTRAKTPLVSLRARFKELEVLRYAQLSGLRRFWDHPDYRIETLSANEFYDITGMVRAFCGPGASKLAA